MLSKKMLEALNEQMTYELNSSYIYLGMASYFQDQNLNGMASWMSTQSQEEWGHGMKFKDYIESRLAQAEYGSLEKPSVHFDSPLDAFKTALKHEQSVTKRIHDLVELAESEKDHATISFLQWFVDEQVEEESSVDYVIQRLEQIGDFRPGLFFLDGELGNRQA